MQLRLKLEPHGLLTEITHLVLAFNETQVIDVSSQKEYSGRQSDRWEVDLFREKYTPQSVGHLRWPPNTRWLVFMGWEFHRLMRGRTIPAISEKGQRFPRIGPLFGLLWLASELSWHRWVWHLDANILPWAYNEALGPIIHHLGFAVVWLLSCVWLFAIPWTASGQVSLSFAILHWVCSNSDPLSWWCCPNTSFSVTPFSFPQSSPASRSFLMSWLFASGGQSTGVLASVLPMNIQGWFLKF